MFLFMCLHIEFDPYMHVIERAEILRDEAEGELKKEFRRMQVIHMLMGLSKKSATAVGINQEFEAIREKIAGMEVEMEIQHEIAQRLHHPWYNYNRIELVVLTCSVFVPLMGIMFNSDYLSRPENYWKSVFITIGTIAVAGISLVYLFVCIVHEIRHTREFRRQRSLILWSRLRHNMKKTVKVMKLRMNFQEKKRLGLDENSGNSKKEKRINSKGLLKRSGTFTKKMDVSTPAEKALSLGASGNSSNAMGEESVDFLAQQHGLTQKLLEEKFANMMEKFNHMRSENELQREKMLNEQRKTTKVALAGAMAAKKASIASPVNSVHKQSNVGGNEHSSTGSKQSQQQQGGGDSTQSNLNAKKKNCCRRLYEWADKNENMLLGVAFIIGLLVLIIISF